MAKKRSEISPGHNDLVVDLYDGDELEDVRYGRWRDAKDGRYLVPALLSGSDYSGSLVEKSNYKKWEEKWPDGEDVWWTHAPGGHGTYAIVIDMEAIPEDVEENVAEFLNALVEDYPLADEKLHSQMETEAQDEAWSDWAAKDFARALEKKFAQHELDLDDVKGEDLYELFRKASEEANEYWVNEHGDSMWINIDKIVKHVSIEDVEDLEGVKIKSDTEALIEYVEEEAGRGRRSKKEIVEEMYEDGREAASATGLPVATVVDWAANARAGLYRARMLRKGK